MKIVIDIPETKLKALQTRERFNVGIGSLEKAVLDGTTLPEGHGRLIDADDVKQNHELWIGYLDEDMIARLNIAIDKHVPTIIAAAE